MNPQLSDDRGSTSVEIAILVPVIVLVGMLVVAAGRINSAQQAVDHAAATAAREASLARAPTSAASAARDTANRVLAQRDLACATTSVTVDTSGLAARPGTLGLVRATVRCSVPLSDLGVPGLPGSKTLTATMASPVDPFRSGEERAP
jgi:Flp pilus assembly protein TadG